MTLDGGRTTLEGLDVKLVPLDEVPKLLGQVVELEARLRLRLTEATVAPAAESKPPITAHEAAIIAGTSERWLLAKTRGLPCRRDLSRKQPRFDETALRAWLAKRRK